MILTVRSQPRIAAAVLGSACTLLARPQRWCKHAEARIVDGTPVAHDHPRAAAFSIVGACRQAIRLLAGSAGDPAALALIERTVLDYLTETARTNPETFNDAPSTHFGEAVLCLRQALADALGIAPSPRDALLAGSRVLLRLWDVVHHAADFAGDLREAPPGGGRTLGNCFTEALAATTRARPGFGVGIAAELAARDALSDPCREPRELWRAGSYGAVSRDDAARLVRWAVDRNNRTLETL